MEEDRVFMARALELAGKAFEAGDTPIGAVLVLGGKIIGEGYNKRNALHHPLEHAELEAIDQGARYMGDWRLEETCLYVTLEPCPMCAGAIVQSRIPRVVIGAMNPKAGCAGSVVDLLRMPGFNHQAEVVTGVMAEESADLLKRFFAGLREEERRRKELAAADAPKEEI